MLLPVPAHAQDFFTGMIVADGDKLLLERCHVGKTRYRLSAVPPRFFRGYTYPNGDTAYTAGDSPINIQLRGLDAIDEPLPTSCEDGRSEDGDHPQSKLENRIAPALTGKL